MPIFGAKSRAMRGCASKLACGRRIDPADCTVYTEICGEFVASRRADEGIGPYRVLQEFAAAHRADRGVRPYASLGNPLKLETNPLRQLLCKCHLPLSCGHDKRRL